MGRKSRFDDYDDRHDHHKKSGKKFKGHQTRYGRGESEFWDNLINEDFEEEYISPKPRIVSPAPVSKTINTIRTIRGTSIDYKTVYKIEAIDSIYNNKNTYGVKYYYKDRSIRPTVFWFNIDQTARDSFVQTEKAFLQNVKGVSYGHN